MKKAFLILALVALATSPALARGGHHFHYSTHAGTRARGSTHYASYRRTYHEGYKAPAPKTNDTTGGPG